MNIFNIFAAASFEYAVYSNLAATDPQTTVGEHLDKIFSDEYDVPMFHTEN